MKKHILAYTIILFQLVLAFTVLLMFLNAFHLSEEKNNLFFSKIWKYSFVLILLAIIGKIISIKKISSKWFVIGLLVAAFFVRLLWVLNVEVTPVSDFKLMLETAQNLNAGDKSAVINDKYFNLWTYNIPFTLYESFILKITNSVFSLKLLNVIFGTGIVGLIYLISKNLFNENSARVSGIIACLFPPFILYTGILTNQTIAIFFILMGLYSSFTRNNYLITGLCLGVGHIFRPIGLVFLIAIFIFIIFKWLQKEDFSIRSIKKSTVGLVKLIIPYQLIIALTSFILIFGNYSYNSLYHNSAPGYKLLVGLNHESKGGYSNDDANLLSSSNFQKMAKEKIEERLSDKTKLMFLFQEKFKNMWSSQDASFYWSNWYGKDVRDISEYMWISILFLAFLSIILNKQNVLLSSLSTIYAILGMFIIVYLLIEIQTRYRYEIYPFFVILAGNGLYMFLKRCKKVFSSV